MPGRLQKVAALTAAVSLFAVPAFADDANAPGAALAAIGALAAQRDRTVLELSGASDVERWSLRAGSYRGEWDSAEALALPGFDWRSAMAGDVARASLAFDWKRRIGQGGIEGGAFARLARIDVASGLGGTTLEQRLRESSFGAALRWNGAVLVAGLPAAQTLSASFRGIGRDAAAGATDERGELRLTHEDRLDESSLTFGASSEIALPAGIRAEAGLTYDLHRAAVRSDTPARAGDIAASTLSPHVRLRARVPLAGEVFLTWSRGNPTDAPAHATMTDPRTGASVARLDPLRRMNNIEIGFRRRLPLGIETTVSMFRAASDLEVLLTGENAITQFSRPTVRQGVQLAARYQPARWLTLDFQAAALHARFADGAAEYVPGAAERNASAAASVRIPGGWSTSLAVSYLGKRSAVDESASLAASTFVNARLTRNLSKNTRLAFDVFNVFDQRLRDVDYFSASRMSNPAGAGDSYLFNPAEPRGFRLKLRTTF